MFQYVGIYVKLNGSQEDILAAIPSLKTICEWFKCRLLHGDTGELLDFNNPTATAGHIQDNTIAFWNDSADGEAYTELIAPSASTVSSTWQATLCQMAAMNPHVSYLIEFDDWYNDDTYYEETKCTYDGNGTIEIYRQRFEHDVNSMGDDEFLNAVQYFKKAVSYEHYVELLKQAKYKDSGPILESVTPKNYLEHLINELVWHLTQVMEFADEGVDKLIYQEGISWSSYLESEERKQYDKETGRGMICKLHIK